MRLSHFHNLIVTKLQSKEVSSYCSFFYNGWVRILQMNDLFLWSFWYPLIKTVVTESGYSPVLMLSAGFRDLIMFYFYNASYIQIDWKAIKFYLLFHLPYNCQWRLLTWLCATSAGLAGLRSFIQNQFQESVYFNTKSPIYLPYYTFWTYKEEF